MYSPICVLLEYLSPENQAIYTSSGILFSDKYILSTSNVLSSYLQSNRIAWNDTKSGELNFNLLNLKNSPKVNVVINRVDDGLKFMEAQVVATFVCDNILKSSEKYLRDWSIDIHNNRQQCHMTKILSLFFILTLNDTKDKNYEELYRALRDLLENSQKLKIGQDIFMESTPFGNRAFIRSYSQGIVSNIVGVNSSLILTDCSAAPGSEGSPVFFKTLCKERHLCGIVISCLNWWKGEWVGLTLVANLSPLLIQLLSSTLNKREIIALDTNFLFPIQQSVVQVVCGATWGTAILLDKRKGIFLTNSHVVEIDNKILLCRENWKWEASLLYQTPNSSVYDLAVLQCNEVMDNLTMTQTSISLKSPTVGDEVFAVGYSLFPRELKPKPTVSKGHIAQIQKTMIKTTCTVLPGSSGGAIVTPTGKLLAVIVSNIKMEEEGVIYPRVNMAIPISDVYPIIKKFLSTGDERALQKLQIMDISAIREWNPVSAKL